MHGQLVRALVPNPLQQPIMPMPIKCCAGLLSWKREETGIHLAQEKCTIEDCSAIWSQHGNANSSVYQQQRATDGVNRVMDGRRRQEKKLDF